MPTMVKMPQLGESVIEGTIIRWMKNVGDTILEYESLLEVSTDKVDTEIPSPAAGTILRINASEGETIPVGEVIAWIGLPNESIPEDPEQSPEKAPQNASHTDTNNGSGSPVPQGMNVERRSQERSRGAGFISPIVAKMVNEFGIDITKIRGTGQGGRVTKKDVVAYMDRTQKQNAQETAGEKEVLPWETYGDGDLFHPTETAVQKNESPASQTERLDKGEYRKEKSESLIVEEKLIPISRMRHRIAEHMVASVKISPHVTTVMEADLHRLVAHYRAYKPIFAKDGVNLTYTAYFAAAVIQALRLFPIANSSWRENGIFLHSRINIGIAVSLGEDGLIVPVIKGSDSLSLFGLAKAINDIANRSRTRSLKPADIEDGTFTITNHGVNGSLFATPIIHQPQAGILGIGAVKKRVVVTEDDTIAIRPMVYLSFVFDHRILDGATADGYLSHIVKELEEWKS